MSPAIVLDASALVSIVIREPGYEGIVKSIEEADVILIGAPTLLEAATVLGARLRSDARPLLMEIVRRIRATLVPYSEEHFDSSIEAFLRFGKGRHAAALNFGDCLTYAVADVSGLPLLFTGQDFAQTDIQAARS